MVFPLPSYSIPVNIAGEVVRTNARGIGLKFKLMRPTNFAPAMGGLNRGKNYSFGTAGKVRPLPKARRKRVRWAASADPNVIGYKLYWAAGENLSYDSSCMEVGYLAEVILPDDLPTFPLVAGEVQLGLTALNYLGNESDMTKFTVSFDFTPQSIR